MHNQLIDFIQDIYATKSAIALHEPQLGAKEIEQVTKALNSGYVSSVGEAVDAFSSDLESLLDAKFAIPLVNGTAALHLALYLNNVSQGDLVICPALTFVASCNAVRYLGAEPIFIDVNETSLGLCPVALAHYLEEHSFLDDDGRCIHSDSGHVIRSCIAVHTLGHGCDLAELSAVCARRNISVIEDAAQALGSKYQSKYIGSDSSYACFSFNGNKIITTGGGGALISNTAAIAIEAKHVSTTSRVAGIDIDHDALGFNYRMPNLNAALGLAQLTRLERFVEKKRALANQYDEFFSGSDLTFYTEKKDRKSNYWLNAVMCSGPDEKQTLLKKLSDSSIGARPLWKLMVDLPMYKHCERGPLTCSRKLYDRTVCLPSSVRCD